MQQIAPAQLPFGRDPERSPHRFVFDGNASEYFGIWIVNLLLTLATLGIYSAWAKVRRLRYFYGNTVLDGHNFEYHARPRQILIGRIIVVVALLVYNGLVQLVHPAFAILLVPYLLAFPWLLNKAVAFNARMTSYRNVRFAFRGSYWGALGVFILMPVAVLLTLGLLAPVASRLSANYVGRGLSYGTAPFLTDAPVGQLYGNLGKTILFALVCIAIVGGLFALPILVETRGGGIEALLTAVGFFSIVLLYLIVLLVAAFYRAGVRNIVYRATTLDGRHRLGSEVSRLRYAWILASNLVATLVTLGLAIPWTQTRSWGYLASRTTLLAAGPLDTIVDAAAPDGQVAAAEYFDLEGIDIGL